MDISKRNFIARVTCWAVAIPLGSLLVRGLAFGQGQKNQAPPQIPGQNPDGTLPNTATSTVGLDPKEMLKHHQQQIHDDVEKLYELAGELKAEVEKTETEHVLSLPMIQKAEQIEKLAKQVKGLARES
jgi:hypothetical protein